MHTALVSTSKIWFGAARLSIKLWFKIVIRHILGQYLATILSFHVSRQHGHPTPRKASSVRPSVRPYLTIFTPSNAHAHQSNEWAYAIKNDSGNDNDNHNNNDKEEEEEDNDNDDDKEEEEDNDNYDEEEDSDNDLCTSVRV